MKRLKHFSIPLLGLKDGKHELTLKLDKEVFDSFDFGQIHKGEFEANVSVTRASGHFDLDYTIHGYMNADCDRCMTEIAIPLKADDHYVIKIGDERKVVDDVIYVLQSDHELNIAEYLYESICLQVPMVKTVECDEMAEEEKPCDMKTLSYLEEQENEQTEGSIWDGLKKIKFEN